MDEGLTLKAIFENMLGGGFNTIDQSMDPNLFDKSVFGAKDKEPEASEEEPLKNYSEWPPQIGAKYTSRSAMITQSNKRIAAGTEFKIKKIVKKDSKYLIQMSSDNTPTIHHEFSKGDFGTYFKFQQPEEVQEQIERKLEVIIERFINQRKQQWRKRTM